VCERRQSMNDATVADVRGRRSLKPIHLRGLPILALPVDALARIRWFFLFAACLATASILPLLAFWSNSAWPLRAAAGAGIVLLALCWLRQYALGTNELAWDLAEGPLLFIIAVVAQPDLTIGTFFLPILFHNLYPTTRRATIRFFVYGGAYLAAECVAPQPGGALSGAVLINVAGFAMYTGIMQVFTASLLKHEGSLRREQALRQAAVALTAAATRDSLYAAAQEAFQSLLAEVTDAQVSILIQVEVALSRFDSASLRPAAGGDGRVTLGDLPDAVRRDGTRFRRLHS